MKLYREATPEEEAHWAHGLAEMFVIPIEPCEHGNYAPHWYVDPDDRGTFVNGMWIPNLKVCPSIVNEVLGLENDDEGGLRPIERLWCDHSYEIDYAAAAEFLPYETQSWMIKAIVDAALGIGGEG